MNSQRYKGIHSYKMDSKYRVSIKPSWRPEQGSNLFLLFSREYDLPLVKVLTEEAYNEKVELIKASDKTPADKGKLLGKLAAFCTEASLNDQGKLLIPKEVSERADIAADSDVTLVGRGIHFEIWNRANFDKVLAIQAAEVEDDDLGIF